MSISKGGVPVKKTTLLIALLALGLSLLLAGCGTVTPRQTGQVVFSVTVPAGVSVYPPSLFKTGASREIPAGTDTVDIYIFDSYGVVRTGSITSFTEDPDTHVRTGSVTIDGIPANPGGTSYSVQALAGSFGTVTHGGQTDNVLVYAGDTTFTDVTLSAMTFDLTTWSVAPSSGDAVIFGGKFVAPFDIKWSNLDNIISEYPEMFIELDTATGGTWRVPSDTSSLLGMYTAGTVLQLTFNGTAPTVSATTVYTTKYVYVQYTGLDGMASYHLCVQLLPADQVAVTVYPLTGSMVVGIQGMSH